MKRASSARNDMENGRSERIREVRYNMALLDSLMNSGAEVPEFDGINFNWDGESKVRSEAEELERVLELMGPVDGQA
jgi:hypothetical protein